MNLILGEVYGSAQYYFIERCHGYLMSEKIYRLIVCMKITSLFSSFLISCAATT